MLVHSVYFWLKGGLSSADREAFRQGLESLTAIKSAREVYIGSPAPTPKRPIVESSYDFGLIVVLPDMAAHDAYQIDPVHKAFIAKFSPMWERLLVFDVQ
ncbi:MAG: Dabb family protein [Phycisphaerae bacterium]